MKDPGKLKTPSGDPGIMLVDQMTTLNVLSLYLEEKVQHVVQKSNLNFDGEIKLSCTMTQSPDDFISYPLSAILAKEKPSKESEERVTGVSIEVERASDKHDILDVLTNYVEGQARPQTIAQDVRLAADELLTNAVYNAPFVDMENSASGAPREAASIIIDPAKRPRIFCGRDETRIVVGCTDKYGRLNIPKLIERIYKCYSLNPGTQVNFGPGGAGLGAFMIFDSCISLYVAVEAGKSTTISCAFPLSMSQRRRHEIPKNIHITYKAA